MFSSFSWFPSFRGSHQVAAMQSIGLTNHRFRNTGLNGLSMRHVPAELTNWHSRELTAHFTDPRQPIKKPLTDPGQITSGRGMKKHYDKARKIFNYACRAHEGAVETLFPDFSPCCFRFPCFFSFKENLGQDEFFDSLPFLQCWGPTCRGSKLPFLAFQKKRR